MGYSGYGVVNPSPVGLQLKPCQLQVTVASSMHMPMQATKRSARDICGLSDKTQAVNPEDPNTLQEWCHTHARTECCGSKR